MSSKIGLEAYELTRQEEILPNDEFDQGKIELQTNISALQAITAVGKFFLCALFALLIAPLFPTRVKYLMINQARNVHSAFHIANKKAYAIANKVLNDLESNTLTRDEAFKCVQKAREEMIEGLLGQNFHNMDAIDYLDNFVDHHLTWNYKYS